MFIRIKIASNGHKKIQLVESVRQGNRVSQKVVRHIGTAQDDTELKQLRNLAHYVKARIEDERQPKLFPSEKMAELSLIHEDKKVKTSPVHVEELYEESRHVVGIHDVYGEVYKQLEFNRVLPNPARNKQACDYLRHIVMARIANPCSKHKSVNLLSESFGVSLQLDKVYRMMDKLGEPAIESLQKKSYLGAQKTLALFDEEIDVLFYDATTLYFESFQEDKLKQNGYSKDMKFNQPQVLLSLFVTSHGLPVGYEVFPGSTYEGHTLLPMLASIRERFNLRKVVFVADSGLLSQANLELLEQEGYDYIVGARLKGTSKEIQAKITNRSLYQPLGDEGEFQTIEISSNPSRNLIISYSEKRAKKDKHDRETALKKLCKKLSKSKNPSSLISNYGYKKYLQIQGDAKVVLDKEKLKKEEVWDGLHGVVTNDKNLKAQDILDHYKGLWQVEETFRISKHDLKIRPIFHWTTSRIRAHIAICYMALCCVRYLEYCVKKHYKKLSPQVIRETLISVQASVLKHKFTKKTYILPSCTKEHASKIYQIVGLKLAKTPFLLK